MRNGKLSFEQKKTVISALLNELLTDIRSIKSETRLNKQEPDDDHPEKWEEEIDTLSEFTEKIEKTSSYIRWQLLD